MYFNFLVVALLLWYSPTLMCFDNEHEQVYKRVFKSYTRTTRKLIITTSSGTSMKPYHYKSCRDYEKNAYDKRNSRQAFY
jgi:1-deoxy-D-xylulose 5-phosphate reductoisomerase